MHESTDTDRGQSVSDTPRTDAAKLNAVDKDGELPWFDGFHDVIDEMEQLECELSKVTEQRDRLRDFARAVMKSWPHGDVDGGELQELAIKHGLIAEKSPKPTQPCCETCFCAEMVTPDEWERGIVCYQKTDLIREIEESK